MTRDRDIERVLDSWFSEGPTRMPGDFLNGVVDRIERVPQRRIARLKTRLLTVHVNLRLAAAAAVIIFVAGFGTAVLSRAPGSAGLPTPPPSSSPATTPQLSLVPQALRSTWRSVGTRLLSGGQSPSWQSIIVGEAGIRQPEFKADVLYSAFGAGPGRLLVRLDAAFDSCSAGDEGTYSFTLAPDGNSLTLAPVDDACSARAAVLAGDWIRSACPDPAFCLGGLTAGPHVSANFLPFVAIYPPTGNEIYGKFSYTAPVGWANGTDEQTAYSLALQGVAATSAIHLFSDIAPHLQGPGCPTGVAPGVDRSASGIVAWLRTLPSLVTTVPTPVTVGGLNGLMLDVSVLPGWAQTCSTKVRYVSTLTGTDRAKGVDVNLAVGTRSRYILLDLSSATSSIDKPLPAFAIVIEAANQADLDAMLPEAMSIVSTFQFRQ